MKRVDLYSLTQSALIIPCPTGIVYLQQCGGTACMQREMEGVLVPIDYDYELENYTESLEYELTSLFPEGNPGVITQQAVELIQRMLDTSIFTRGIVIDHSRLAESVESWLYVRVSSDLDGILHGFGKTEAVLTWPNSD
jgi:hypothetical protein